MSRSIFQYESPFDDGATNEEIAAILAQLRGAQLYLRPTKKREAQIQQCVIALAIGQTFTRQIPDPEPAIQLPDLCPAHVPEGPDLVDHFLPVPGVIDELGGRSNSLALLLKKVQENLESRHVVEAQILIADARTAARYLAQGVVEVVNWVNGVEP